MQLTQPQALSFPLLYPGEKRVLTFRMLDLVAGETLVTPTVDSITNSVDGSNGSAIQITGPTCGVDSSGVAVVLVPVYPVTDGAVYDIVGHVTTSNTNKVLNFYGILRVKKPF